MISYYYQDGVTSYTTDGEGEQTSQNLIGLEGNIIGTQRYDGEKTSYYLYNKDIQGSTTSLIKEDGTADAVYRYTDFGETTIEGDNNAGNEVCYTGGIYDSTTGLYYLNARYYNPEDGRFLTEDTYRGETKEPDTWHLYAYCKNNPVNYTDPSGHFYVKIFSNWEAIGQYWYDKRNNKRFGRKTTPYIAKNKNDKNLKKYKKYIKEENVYINKIITKLGIIALKLAIKWVTIGRQINKIIAGCRGVFNTKWKKRFWKIVLGSAAAKLTHLSTGGDIIKSIKYAIKSQSLNKKVVISYKKIKKKRSRY